MRRVVQKRTDDADRRKREAKEKGQADLAAKAEKNALEERKAEDKERLAREAKVPFELGGILLPRELDCIFIFCESLCLMSDIRLAGKEKFHFSLRRVRYDFSLMFPTDAGGRKASKRAESKNSILLRPPRPFQLLQEKEAKEQKELNELADNDPAEYDRRIKEWHKKKMDSKDPRGAGRGDKGGSDGDLSENLERRKSLARQRRDAR